MGDVSYVVDSLNLPPFSYQISLLQFTEKGPHELLQLLSDVFSAISAKHQKVDVSKEVPDQTADRLIGFLKIIKYKPSVQDPLLFRQMVAAGDRDTIYQILRWVVPQPQLLEKRAFVGYYLSFPDMPEEFNFDPDIMELKEEIKNMQQEFIELHKSSDAIKTLSKDTQALKNKIKSLEEEKERLGEKVERAKGAVDKLPDRASYMDVCTALRKQQDEEVNLSTAIQTQKAQLEKAEGSYHRAAARLRELQLSYQEGSAAKLLETLSADVGNLRAQVNERYPKEVEKRQKRLAALSEALASGISTESDLQRLQNQATTLHNQITEIQDRKTQQDKARQGDKAFLQLRQAQQMASVVGRKKEDLLAKNERLQEKKTALTAQLDKLNAEGGGSGAVFSEEEWRNKYESMKGKLPVYKKMKKELGDIEAEVFVLAHTEELLAAQEQGLLTKVKQLERQQGIAVMSVVRWSTDDEVVALANDCAFGLGSSVFTGSTRRANAIAARLEAGMSAINDFGTTYMCQSLPFGGVKHSGFDRFAGVEGLRGLCVPKSVCEDRWPLLMKSTIPPPWEFPVKPNGFAFGTSLVRMFYSPGLLGQAQGLAALLKCLVFPAAAARKAVVKGGKPKAL